MRPSWSQRFIAAVDRLTLFRQSGRIVPEVADPLVRELIQGSYRIVYRLIRKEVHVLTVHHAACLFRLEL